MINKYVSLTSPPSFSVETENRGFVTLHTNTSSSLLDCGATACLMTANIEDLEIPANKKVLLFLREVEIRVNKKVLRWRGHLSRFFSRA